MAQNNWRFFDNPLKGHWRHLPDDLRLQRGPTIVILPDGRRLRVPAMSKRMVQAPGDLHDAADGDEMLKSLQRLLSGKHGGPKSRPGFHPGRHAAGQRIGGPHPDQAGRLEAPDRLPRPVVGGGGIGAEA